MATSELDETWRAAFPERTRPEVYISKDFNEDGFRPLADPSDFMTDVSKLTPAQLYAQAFNNQKALQQAQDEYLELEKIINQLKTRDPTVVTSTKNPQSLPSYQDFDERKEAVLYGYKYDPNRPLASYGRWQDVTEQERRDLRSYQDPFTQGGFIPNDRQYKGILNRAKDKRNPDGWVPVEEDGKRLVPRMAPRVNEKEEYWQLSGLLSLAKTTVSKPVTRSGTPDPEGLSFGGRDTPVNKRLRNTRFNGSKVPLTRDVSEAPSLPISRASTPKRKRGDTPVLSFDSNGSPVKKPKLVVLEADIQMPPRRKHHNQYTKAREKAALEAMMATQKPSVKTEDVEPVLSPIIVPVPQAVNVNHNIINNDNHAWAHLTDQEKRDFHWNNDTLLLAVKQDPTWLNEDPKTRQKWTKKILESKYPVRTYSMYKKWDYWRHIGEDKRPRNKKKSGKSFDGDEGEMDAVSEMNATNTPSPRSRSFNMHDLDEEDELAHVSMMPGSGPSKLGQGEILMEDYSDNEVAFSREGVDSRATSASDSVSQTISVSRDDGPAGARRVTRASRVTSS